MACSKKKVTSLLCAFHKKFLSCTYLLFYFFSSSYTNVNLDPVIDFTIHWWVETYSLKSSKYSWVREIISVINSKKNYSVLLCINLTYVRSLSFIFLLWIGMSFYLACFRAERSLLGVHFLTSSDRAEPQSDSLKGKNHGKLCFLSALAFALIREFTFMMNIPWNLYFI